MTLRQSINSNNAFDVFKNINHLAGSKKTLSLNRKNSLNVTNLEIEDGHINDITGYYSSRTEFIIQKLFVENKEYFQDYKYVH